MDVRPFTIRIPDQQIDDLQRRLGATRWPDSHDDESWDGGTSLAFARRLIEHWRTRFDWRAREAELNRLPQFLADVDGQSIHFVHQRGTGPAPMPLIVTHGWPGSFVEMERILPLLTDPGAHGGDPADAFHVVVPSLPGFGFSAPPPAAGCGPHRIAELWLKLMTGLGYARFGAQGGDWGSSVSAWLAHRFPERVLGLHLNFIPSSYRPPLGADHPPVSDAEQAFLAAQALWADAEGGYSHIQGTKPQTLAFGLTDSPAGLAAWIAEKFRAWSDCDGDVERSFSLDDLLANISLYWFSGTAASTLRIYRESRQRPIHFLPGERVAPPLGVAQFPRELPMPPRSWLDRVFTVDRWTTMPRGGHFAAMEEPELLAEEVRAFFRPLRSRWQACDPGFGASILPEVS
jgi:pimeloyl-ACP methyl ester carboxylesterase